MPKPYCCATGRTSRSMPRFRIEYGGCSVRNRSRPRRSATHCASTRSEAGIVEVPDERILPLRTRSVSADRVSSISVSGSGRWIWSTSMWSVCRRRSEFSTAVMIHRREAPCWFGSAPMGRLTFVVRTTLSRRPLSARPTTSSESPYASAVSTRLMPASSALWMIRIEASGSGLPTCVANMSAPSAYGLTLMPVPPRLRYCKSAAASAGVVEPGARQSRSSDLRLVRTATGGIRGVEPLVEELGQPGAARRTLIRHPLMERRLQLGLGDAAATVFALELIHGLREVGRTQDLAQRDVGDAGPGVGGIFVEQVERCRVRWRVGPETFRARVQGIEDL